MRRRSGRLERGGRGSMTDHQPSTNAISASRYRATRAPNRHPIEARFAWIAGHPVVHTRAPANPTPARKRIVREACFARDQRLSSEGIANAAAYQFEAAGTADADRRKLTGMEPA